MSFHLDVLKTIQAIGVLYRADCTKKMDYKRILKLLYIADRRSFEQTAAPIVGGPVAAWPKGPVLSEVHQLIKERHEKMSLWSRFFQFNNYQLEMIGHPDIDRLSPYDVATLQYVAAKHKADNAEDLSDITHDFPEWENNEPAEDATEYKDIATRDILVAVGHGDEADKIISLANNSARMRELLAK